MMLKNDLLAAGTQLFKLKIVPLSFAFLMTCSASQSAETAVVKPVTKPVTKPVEQPVRVRTFVTTIDNRKVAIEHRHLRRLMKVKNKGILFYYPTSVPARFSLRFIKTPHLNNRPDYAMQFRDQKHFSFTIETAYGGIGNGPHGYRTISGFSKEFGAFKIHVFKPHAEGNKTNSMYYQSDWLKPKRKQSKSASRYYHFFGTGVNDSEAISIVKSLTPIK